MSAFGLVMQKDPELSYRISATAREGDPPAVSTSDHRLQLSLSTPRELGGASNPGVNAEELLAAAYAGCLLQALRHEALKRVLDLRGAEVVCTVHLAGGEHSFALDVALAVSTPSLTEEKANELVAAACSIWPYAEERAPNRPRITLTKHSGSSPAADAESVISRRGYGG